MNITSSARIRPKRGIRRGTPPEVSDITMFDNPWSPSGETLSGNPAFKSVVNAKGVLRKKKTLWCEAFDISPWVASNAERKKAPWKLFPSREFRLKYGDFERG